MDETSKFASRKFVIVCIANIGLFIKILVLNGGPESLQALVAIDSAYFGINLLDAMNQAKIQQNNVVDDKSD